MRFGVRKRREDRVAATFLPAVSVLKPLHGIEPGLERNIESFFEQDYPEFELLFCARHETDAGSATGAAGGRALSTGGCAVSDVRRAYAGVSQCQGVLAGEAGFSGEARAFYYQRCRCASDEGLSAADGAESEGSGDRACIVRVYRDGRRGAKAGLSSQLDAVGKSVEMTSGVLVADMLEGTKFALGRRWRCGRSRFRRRADSVNLVSFMPMILFWATGWRRRESGCAWRRM